MSYIFKTLITLSIIAFLIAVLVSVFKFNILGVSSEGYSQACNNIILIAIASKVCLYPDYKK